MKSFIPVILFFGLFLVPSLQVSPKLIWLDTDPGIDEGVLDDAIAIFLSGYNPNVKLVGITTVAGNAAPDNIRRNVLNLLNLAKIPTEVATGAEGPLLREKYTPDPNAPKVAYTFPSHTRTALNENAIDYIYTTIKAQSPNKVTILGIGPLTNIAILVKTYPDIVDYIDEIVFLGGSFGSGNVSPVAEFNVWCDPDATRVVIQSGAKVTMVPMDVTGLTAMNDAIITQFEAMGQESDFGRFLMAMIDFRRKNSPDLFIPVYSMFHDAVVLVYMINPSLFTTRMTYVQLDTKSDVSYGSTVCDLNGALGQTPNVNLVVDVDVNGYWTIVMNVLKELSAKSKAGTL